MEFFNFSTGHMCSTCGGRRAIAMIVLRLLFAGWYWTPRSRVCTVITEASIDHWAPERATRGTSRRRLMEVATVWHSRATFINGSRYYLVHRPRVRISGPAWHPAPTITWTTKTRRSTVLAGILAYRMAQGTVSLNSTYLHLFEKNLVFLKRNGKRSLVRTLSSVSRYEFFFSRSSRLFVHNLPFGGGGGGCARRSSDVMFYAREQ